MSDTDLARLARIIRSQASANESRVRLLTGDTAALNASMTGADHWHLLADVALLADVLADVIERQPTTPPPTAELDEVVSLRDDIAGGIIVRPGDTVLLELDDDHTVSHARRLRDELLAAIPDLAGVVLIGGARIGGIYRPETS